MAADYYVTGIWVSKNDQSEFISHVKLYDNKGFSEGVKTSKSDIIKLIDDKNIIKTAVWNYKTVKWTEGAIISKEHLNTDYLRTERDGIVSNNLHNMPRMLFKFS